MKSKKTSKRKDANKSLIGVPARWTRAKDRKYFHDIFGAHSDFPGLFEQAAIDQKQVLDRTLACLCAGLGLETADIAAHLSESSKLDLLTALVRLHPMTEQVQSRIVADVDRWRRVSGAVATVVRRYVLDPGSVWLRELVDAHDWLVTASSRLEATFDCAFPGFRLSAPLEEESGITITAETEVE